MPPLASAAHSFPAFLANQFQPISADFQLNVYNVLSAVALVLAVFAYFRRRPTVDVDLSKLQGSIDALQTTVQRLSTAQEKHASHDSEIRGLKDRMHSLEAQRERDSRTQREELAQVVSQLGGRIDIIGETVRENFQSVERAIGRVEGAIETVRDHLNARS